MIWTKQAPDKPGYYWYKDKSGEVELIKIEAGLFNDDSLAVWFFGSDQADIFNDLFLQGAWIGPIEEPQ